MKREDLARRRLLREERERNERVARALRMAQDRCIQDDVAAGIETGEVAWHGHGGRIVTAYPRSPK